MNSSPEIKQLVAALAIVQGGLAPAKEGTENPFFKSKYADLAEIWKVCREPLAIQGLAVIQTVGQAKEGGGLVLETILAHKSGEWISSACPILAKDATAQSMGSAITYARRYSLAAIVGIVAGEDDDGNQASQGKPAAQKKEAPKPEPAKAAVPSPVQDEPALIVKLENWLKHTKTAEGLAGAWTDIGLYRGRKEISEAVYAKLSTLKDERKADFAAAAAA